jgi:3'(2'), 5'-bisphosphate nucleotidase
MSVPGKSIRDPGRYVRGMARDGAAAMGDERMLENAVAAVISAGRLCREVSREALSGGVAAKADRSPVTVADFGVQAVISHRLAAAAPGIPLVGEEDAGALRGPELAGVRSRVVVQVRREAPELDEAGVLAAIDRGGHPGGAAGVYWALDPIDGTKGFLRGDQYAVALALIEDGRVSLGVLGCPNLPWDAARPEGPAGCLFVARRGHGAWWRALDEDGEPHPIRVDTVADPAAAVFCESVESGHTAHGRAAAIAARLGVTAPPHRIDSQCKYAAIARGDASIYLRLPTSATYQEKIWDHAAGSILVEEAGGTVTDVAGRPLDFSQGRTLRHNRGVVATNGRFHQAVVDAVQAVGAGG